MFLNSGPEFQGNNRYEKGNERKEKIKKNEKTIAIKLKHQTKDEKCKSKVKCFFIFLVPFFDCSV